MSYNKAFRWFLWVFIFMFLNVSKGNVSWLIYHQFLSFYLPLVIERLHHLYQFFLDHLGCQQTVIGSGIGCCIIPIICFGFDGPIPSYSVWSRVNWQPNVSFYIKTSILNSYKTFYVDWGKNRQIDITLFWYYFKLIYTVQSK